MSNFNNWTLDDDTAVTGYLTLENLDASLNGDLDSLMDLEELELDGE